MIKWLIKLPFRILITPAFLLVGVVGWVVYDDDDTLRELLIELWS